MEFFSPDDVRRVVAYLTKVVNVHGTAHVEIEFRLGRKTAAAAAGGGGFDPGINADLWRRILAGLETNPNWYGVDRSETVDYYNDRKERVTFDTATHRTRTVRKTRLAPPLDIVTSRGPFDVRVSACKEVPVAAPPRPPDETCRYRRHKRRTSFRHEFWSFDLTEVRPGAGVQHQDDDAGAVYEIELELADPGQLELTSLDYVAEYALLLCQDMVRLSGVKD